MTPLDQEAMPSSTPTSVSSQTVHTPANRDMFRESINSIQLYNFYRDDESIHESSNPDKVPATDENPSSNEKRESRIRVTETELSTSTSPDPFFRATHQTEKYELPHQVTPEGIDWHQPFYMSGLFIIGLIGMICHHVYNNAMDGQIVIQPQWPQRFGSAFSFFAKLCMISSVSIAFKQVVWLRIKKDDYSISTLDGIFSICNDPFRYLNFELLWKAKIPAIMAAVIWGLPLCAIVSPSTLASTTGSQETPMTCDDIPTINFQLENGANAASAFKVGQAMSYYTLDPNDNFTYFYNQPSMDLKKVSQLALLSSAPLTLSNPCANGSDCNWQYSFFGPSYDCQERDDFDNSTGLTKSQLVPTGDNIYYSVSTGSEDQYGRPQFWQSETSQNDSDIGTFYYEPVMWIGYVYNTSELLGWDLDWPFLLEPHVMECTLYNTTYDYNISFANGVQVINDFTKTLVSPALPANSSIAPTDPNYEAYAAYHSAGFIFRDQLSKNITQSTGQGMTAYATTNSDIAQTSLINPDTSFAMTDFPTRVEQQFSNIILSLAAYPSLYSQANISGPCTMTSTVLKWDYQPFWLVLSYSIATGISLITICVGFYAFKANGYAADTNFSTFVTTTRNHSLETLSRDCCTEKTPLSKDFMKSKLSFNEVDGFKRSLKTHRYGQNVNHENVEIKSELRSRWTFNKIRNGNDAGHENFKEMFRFADGNICGIPFKKFLFILALIATIIVISITVGVVEGRKRTSAFSSSSSTGTLGANITDCAQSSFSFYIGAESGLCHQISGSDGFEVGNLDSPCTITVYSDMYCSYNATAVDIGQCINGYESFSVDGCP